MCVQEALHHTPLQVCTLFVDSDEILLLHRRVCQVVSTAGAVPNLSSVGLYALGLCTCGADAAGGLSLPFFSCELRDLCNSFVQVQHTSAPFQSVRQHSSSSRMTALRHQVLHLKQQQQQSVLLYSQRTPSTIGESSGAHSFKRLSQWRSQDLPSAFLCVYICLSGERLKCSLHSCPEISRTSYSSCGAVQVPCSLCEGRP